MSYNTLKLHAHGQVFLDKKPISKVGHASFCKKATCLGKLANFTSYTRTSLNCHGKLGRVIINLIPGSEVYP